MNAGRTWKWPYCIWDSAMTGKAKESLNRLMLSDPLWSGARTTKVPAAAFFEAVVQHLPAAAAGPAFAQVPTKVAEADKGAGMPGRGCLVSLILSSTSLNISR
ncbi:hypothetical protein LIA77_02530 [Sarocladium implicatum]|nr:hypothetical protein LIA77_02530 [Sarocladium implicatum]